jgi:Ser/Thr protein kinase RdoA (MazF antagonist)
LLEQLAGVRVPRVRDTHGEVLLLEYVSHEWLPPTPEAGERVGRAAAAIHARRYERAGFLDASLEVPRPFSSALHGLREWIDPMLAGRAGEQLGALCSTVRDAWACERDAMTAASAPVLVHSDFKPMNIGWLPEARDVVVFDWEFAWSGPALLDLGQLLRWNPPAEFVAGVERGYLAAGGFLPERWIRLAELFDLFNLIAFLDDCEPCPQRTRDVLERVHQTLR